MGGGLVQNERLAGFFQIGVCKGDGKFESRSHLDGLLLECFCAIDNESLPGKALGAECERKEGGLIGGPYRRARGGFIGHGPAIAKLVQHLAVAAHDGFGVLKEDGLCGGGIRSRQEVRGRFCAWSARGPERIERVRIFAPRAHLQVGDPGQGVGASDRRDFPRGPWPRARQVRKRARKANLAPPGLFSRRR